MENSPESTPETPQNPISEPDQATMDAASEQGPRENAIAPATVVRLTDAAAIVTFGWKTEGQVPLAEFEVIDGKPAVKAGDQFDVLVETLGEKPEDVLLSKEKAEKLHVWDSLARLGKGGEVDGTVVARVPGGYVIDVGMRAFLPGSQADIRRVGNPDALVGQRLSFTVSEFDKRRGNIVLSRRALLEKEQVARKQEALSRITVGAVLPGTVKSLTDYGAFVDLGGVDGLLHVTEMSWARVGHPREVLKVGQEITVKIREYDPEKGKISLGLKELQEDPWAAAAQKYPVGTQVRGKVVGFADFGAFVALEPGIEGLVHVSEISWKRVKSPGDALRRGQEVSAVVLSLDPKARRLGLGMRQLQPNPWETLHEKYPEGSLIKRKVRGVTDFGLFLGVEDGIDGLVHISELSWLGNVKHPGDLYKPGDEVEAKVLAIDVENERLSLSIKQLTQDPWAVLAEKHPVGSRIKGKVTRIADFGAFVEVEPGIEGLVHISQLSEGRVESVASVLTVGGEIDAKVLDINPRDRKVSLSVKALTEESAEDYREHLNPDEGRTRLGDVFGDTLRKFKK